MELYLSYLKTYLIAFYLLLTALPLYGQIELNFENQNLDLWQQNMPNQWIVVRDNQPIGGSYLMRHNASAVTLADAISLPINGLDFKKNITWSFRLRHEYNPSSQNYWMVYLAADAGANEMTTASVTAYAVGLNANDLDDRLHLYKIQNGVVSTIFRSNYNWESKVGKTKNARLEITRKSSGEWVLKAGLSSLALLGSVFDSEFTDFSHVGLFYKYTPGAKTLLVFDDFKISEGSIAVPVEPVSIDSDSELIPEIVVDFSLPSTATTKDQAESFIKFALQDYATTDTLPTSLTSILLLNANSTNILDLVGGICAEVNRNEVDIDYQLFSDSIRINFSDPILASSGTKTDIVLKLWLRSASLIDHSLLRFKIDRLQHGAQSVLNQSQFRSVFSEDIISAAIDLDVQANRLFIDHCSAEQDVFFTLKAKAVDLNFNSDVDYKGMATVELIEGKGSLSAASGLSKQAQAGVFTWSDLRYDQMDDFRVKIVSGDLKSDSSLLISVKNKTDSTSIIKSSISDVPGYNITPNDSAIKVWQFVIADLADTDTLNTIVTEMTFTNPTNTDWIKTIDDVLIYVNDLKLNTVKVNTSDKEFTLLCIDSLFIANGSSLEVSLFVTFNQQIKDGDSLQFEIGKSHLFKTAPQGSQLQTRLPDALQSNIFRLDVQTKKLLINQQVLQTRVNEKFDLEIFATNEWDVIDLDNNDLVQLELLANSGQLLNSIPKRMNMGKVFWNDLKIDAPVVFQIKVSQDTLEALTDSIAAVDLNSTVLHPSEQIQSSSFSKSDTVKAKEVFKFFIKDVGTFDGLATHITTINIANNLSESSNFVDLIKRVSLKSAGITYQMQTIISSDALLLYPDSLFITDGQELELTLSIYLKNEQTSGTSFQFKIPKTLYQWTAGPSGSQLFANFPEDIVSALFSIEDDPIIDSGTLYVLDQVYISSNLQEFRIKIGVGDDGFNPSCRQIGKKIGKNDLF